MIYNSFNLFKKLLTRAVCLTLLMGTYVHAQETPANTQPQREVAIFAGGCFWCMEPPFEKLEGVDSVISGYVGGDEPNPTYGQVSRGKTGHTEAVKITYDPKKVSYSQLLHVFWRQIDPTTPNRQFVDVGAQYRSGIFYLNESQKTLAIASKKATEALNLHGKPFVTEITAAKTFWPAEEYHQDFYKKSSVRYKYYRNRSGRDQYLKRIWGKQ